MAVAVRGLVRVDRHAADRIDRAVGHAHGGRRAVRRGTVRRRCVMLMRMVGHACPLAMDTPGGYIAGMRKEAKTSCLRRLNRIEGQVRGLARMVDDDRYCIDLITQIAAVRAALRRAEEEILEDHVAHCVEHAIASGNKREQRRKVSELMDVLSRADR